MHDGQFVPVDVQIGCSVEVSSGRKRSDYSLGLVMRKKRSFVDIFVVTAEEIGVFRDCVHDDDPRVEQAEADFWENTNRGTWRLSQPEIDRRRMIEQVNNLTAEANRLTRRLEALEETRAQIAEPLTAPAPRPAPLDVIKPRPGRGRPRTIPIPLNEIRQLTPFRPLAPATQTVADD